MNGMQVIPTINCEDIDCVKTRLEQLRKIFAGLPSSDGATDENWIQIDVSDGKFTPVVTWNNPEQLSEISGQVLDFHIETHLMVQRPEADVKRWLEVGAKRIILHIESEFGFKKMRGLCDEYRAELWLALKPRTSIEELSSYIDSIDGIQVLAVDPGISGQSFQPPAVEKVRSLSQRYPGVTIEVDGGMNPDTAAQVIEAGAKIIAAGSYIFESDNPVEAYQELKNLTPLPAGRQVTLNTSD